MSETSRSQAIQPCFGREFFYRVFRMLLCFDPAATGAGNLSRDFVSNKQEYIARLRGIIENSHDCKATHRRTVIVQEPISKSSKSTARQVEIFWLTDHPVSKRCFAWVESLGRTDAKIITVLEIPPVIGPATAVKSAISSAGRTPVVGRQ